MPKYRMQFTVSVEVSKEIPADSLEEALQCARATAKTCPVHAKLIKIAPRVDYLWDNETVVTGVNEQGSNHDG